MPTEILAAALGHQRLAGAANGVALSTTPAFTPFWKGTKHITLIPRNFVTAVVYRYAFCPYLAVLMSDRAATLDTTPIDWSDIAQDGSTEAPRVVLSGLAAGRYVYMGSSVRFRGVRIDVEDTNSTASTTLTVRYWDGAAWTDLSVTDGTASAVSLDQDGSVTWTMPTAGFWKAEALSEIHRILGLTIADAFRHRDTKLYWTRWEWSQALDSSVTLNSILAMNESTAYAESLVGLGHEERIHHGLGDRGVAGLEALVNAGTGNLLINCAALDGYFSRGQVM